MQKLLFLCSGNYYRSRFAEEYFNHLANLRGIKWAAFSRGLSDNMPNPKNPGPVSKYTIKALKERNVIGKSLDRFPHQVAESDFLQCNKIIALSEQEHQAMIISRFNGHHAKVSYFEVGDLPLEKPDAAMNKLSRLVEQLIEEIA